MLKSGWVLTHPIKGFFQQAACLRLSRKMKF